MLEGPVLQLQPHELAQLNALQSNPAAYREAVWKMIGYTPMKYPAGSDGANQQSQRWDSAVNYINQGMRPISKPNGLGYTSMYDPYSPPTSPY